MQIKSVSEIGIIHSATRQEHTTVQIEKDEVLIKVEASPKLRTLSLICVAVILSIVPTEYERSKQSLPILEQFILEIFKSFKCTTKVGKVFKMIRDIYIFCTC